MNYKDFFKDKKIAIIGLGPHGEMIADIKFLLRIGANISLYDLRSIDKVRGYISILEEAGLTEYYLGKINNDQILDKDLIIIHYDISKKYSFLKRAIEKSIPIEYPNILFLKLVPPITLIGVMGACGKSTVCNMIYTVLKKSFVEYENQGLFFIDPDSTNGSISHLKKIKQGDVVLARIPEELMNEYFISRISPHVAVITSITSAAENKSKDAFSILEYQTYNNFIVGPDDVIDSIRHIIDFTPKAKMLRTHPTNQALAIQTGELFKVSKEIGESILNDFSGLKGRGELIKKVKNVEFYNDAYSTNPKATLYTMMNLSIDRNLILIFGGAYTRYDYRILINTFPQYIKAIVLLPGSGTLGLREDIKVIENIGFAQSYDLEDASSKALELAKKGDRVVFSPGCEAIGIYSSRKDRGEDFIRSVRAL